MKTTAIQEKAMLVSLNITQWTARKYDKKATAAVEETFETANNAGRFRKALLGKGDLQEIQSIITQAREYHREQTLPWLYEGTAILTSANYFHYTEKMRAYKNKLDNAVDAFIAEYPSMKDKARKTLGKLFNPDEYPDAAVVKAKYGLTVQIMPIPSSNDFRVALQNEEVDKIQHDIEAKVKDATQQAMQDLWQRLYDIVEKAHEKFKDEDARIYESMFNHLNELVELLPRLNFTGDSKLEEARKKVSQKLCKLNIEELRWDPDYRKNAAKEAESIMNLMSSYMGV